MRKKHHQCHQDHEIAEDFPVLARRAHDLSCRGSAMLLPCNRFPHAKPNIERQQRRRSARPEHCAPSPRRQNEARRHRGQQIANAVSALHYSRQHSPPLCRSIFHGQRCAHSPLSPHADSVDRSQNQKHRVIGRKAAEQLDHGKEHHIRHQWLAPSIPVRQQAENERSHGPHYQRKEQRLYDLAFIYVEVRRQRVHQEYEDEEVERIQRPAKKAGCYRMPLVRPR